MSAPIVFVDCETDSLRPERKAWEVALIRRETRPDGGFVDREWQAFLPIGLGDADPFALDVGGYWDRHPRGRARSGRADGSPADAVPLLPPVEAARHIMEWTFGATLVGVVPDFDAATFGRLLRASGCVPMWHHHLVDLVSMSLGWLGRSRPDLTATSRSDDLARACGVAVPDPAARHTALGDARWARDWYDTLTMPVVVGAAVDGVA